MNMSASANKRSRAASEKSTATNNELSTSLHEHQIRQRNEVMINSGTSDSDSDRESSDNDENDIDDDDDDQLNQTEVQVDFEARTAEGGDYHGIRRLLQQLFLKAPVDLGAFTEIILAQARDVGSVIKQSEVLDEEELCDDDNKDDDDHVFGITTVVNITDRLKESKCIQHLHTLLFQMARKAADDQTIKLLREILSDHEGGNTHVRRCDVGFLLNERFVNIPPQIAAPLYENLIKEMQIASGKGLKFAFDYYILVSKLYKANAPRKTISKRGGRATTVDVFSNVEDELFFEKENVVWFEYSVADQSDSGLDGDWNGDDDKDEDDDEGMTPFRRVSIVPASELSAIVSQIRDTFVTTAAT